MINTISLQQQIGIQLVKKFDEHLFADLNLGLTVALIYPLWWSCVDTLACMSD